MEKTWARISLGRMEDMEKAVPVFKHLKSNTMGETIMSTPALSDGLMFVRGASTLFAIGGPGTR